MSSLLSQWGEDFPHFLPGMLVTLELTGAAALVGLPFGVLLAALSSSKSRLVRWTAIVVVEVGRGAPGIIVLYIVYYGLPQINLTWSSFPSAVLAMGLTTAAYSSEIFRAGLKAVPHGQKEASQALGLSAFDEFRLVVLPQAIKIVIPPLVGLVILLYQGTSLAYAITVPELLSRAYNAGTITYQFTPPLLLAGVMYAVLSLAGVILIRLRRPNRRPRKAAPGGERSAPVADLVQI